MTTREEFLQEVLPRLHETETALHNGDAGPRFAHWSHNDPVTLYGAAMAGSGWDEVKTTSQSAVQSRRSRGSWCRP